MTGIGDLPKASVIVPTYNASGLLRETLQSLARQRIDPADFEIIVADDGSSDDTRAVAESFSAKYYYQEDLGYRLCHARNGGARLAAAPVLIFLDTGTVAGPDFVARHLAAHDNGTSRLVGGYNYGYDPVPDHDVPGLREALDRLPPEEVVEQYRCDPVLNDCRHGLLSPYDFDLAKMAVPWVYVFGCNCSIKTADFWAVGGYDERFTGWGAEDLEFGYRLSKHGIGFGMDREAWTIEVPVERSNMDVRMREFSRNMSVFLDKYPEPCVEIGWAASHRYDPLDWERYYQDFIAWRRQAGDLDVTGEIDDAMRRIPPGDKIAVLGSGGRLPASFPGTGSAVVMDFDAELLDRAQVPGPYVKHHMIGLRTTLADRSVDTVIITSRLSGLREVWNDSLLTEAHRIARSVQCSPGYSPLSTINPRRELP